jgi:hypothetical protein
MPYDLMSLPLLVGLVGGAFWLVVFAVVAAAAKIYPYDYDREAINSSPGEDVLESSVRQGNEN